MNSSVNKIIPVNSEIKPQISQNVIEYVVKMVVRYCSSDITNRSHTSISNETILLNRAL